MFQIQQEWLSGAVRRTADDIAALNDGISSMTKKATTEFERAARRVTEPLHPAGGEMLKAAGSKPHKDRSAA
jgi:hypothetical protein